MALTIIVIAAIIRRAEVAEVITGDRTQNWPTALVEAVKSGIPWFLTGTLTTFLSVNVFLPWLAHQEHVFQIRYIGLEGISVYENSVRSALERYARYHDRSHPVRVICITGDELFRRPPDPADKDSEPPLGWILPAGSARVLMPDLEDTGRTIQERWESYEKKYRDSIYPSAEDLKKESLENRKNILRFPGNEIRAHTIFCMWRVVLFSSHCIVQNYFPNYSGRSSSSAPVFVFKSGSDFSYYNTFSEMFEKVWERSVTSAPAKEPAA